MGKLKTMDKNDSNHENPYGDSNSDERSDNWKEKN